MFQNPVIEKAFHDNLRANAIHISNGNTYNWLLFMWYVFFIHVC